MSIMYLVSFVVILVATSNLSVSSLIAKNPLDRFNKHLSENEQSDNLQSNIKAAKRLLNDERNANDDSFIALMEAFVGLEKVNSDDLCSLESSELVSGAFNAIKKYVSNPMKDKRRVSRIVVGLANKRAKECLYKLAHEYTGPEVDRFDYYRESIGEFRSYLTMGCREKYQVRELSVAVCALRTQDRSLNSFFDPNSVFMGLADIKGWKSFRDTIVSRELVRTMLNEHFYDNCNKLMETKEQVALIENTISLLTTSELSDHLTPNNTVRLGYLLHGVADYLTCKRLALTNKDKLVNNVLWWFKRFEGNW